MNKLLFTGLLSIVLLAQGQTNNTEIGIEAGPSVIYLRGNASLDNYNHPTAGFYGALSFQFGMGKILALRTNIALERKGSVAKFMATDMNGVVVDGVTTHSNFNYLTVPLLLRASFGSNARFVVNAGPFAGVLLNQNYVVNFNGTKTKQENTESFKPMDWGVSVGVGCQIPMSKNISISIEVRNNTGLYNISDLPVRAGTIKTSSTNFILGVAYKL